MRPHSAAHTEFDDDGFDADDEFEAAIATAAPAQARREIIDPFPEAGVSAREEPEFPDPFAIAEAQTGYTPDAHGFEEDDYAQVPSGAVAHNPVGELIAGAEQALGETAVPRITLHVFSLQQSTRQAAEQAGADRRLARATTLVRSGGLKAAREYYTQQSTPSLIILESDQEPAEMLADLDSLAEVCDPGTKVVVIGRSNDISLYRELIKRGVSEYLVAPIETLPLIRTITSLYSDPAAPFVGRSIAFVGAKGGVGASTIAHNIAYAISERLMASTVIVDFDLPFGTAGLDFNQDPLQGVADALSQPDRLDQTLLERMMVRCTERLSLFAAPARWTPPMRSARRPMRRSPPRSGRPRPS
jgi:pilus assembly protein CpaE